MAVEMKKYKLGDLIEVRRGKSLAGEFYATSGNLIRLTMGNFDYINNCFKQNTSKDNLYFSGKVEEKFILNAGDIITPLTEQTPGLLGCTARIPESGKFIQSQDVALVKCKKDKLDDGFAYYLISSESVKKQLGAAAQQTKIRHTSPDKIKDCVVYIPEIPIQKRIGKILSTLDQRIENLRAQNQVLEQTAKAIYDYTFLQCAGHQTTYNKILNRNIPANWEQKTLNQIESNIVTGKTPSTKHEDNFGGSIAFITIDDIRQNTHIIKTARTLSEKGANTQSKKYLPEGSLCVSCIGTIGEVGFSVGSSQTNQQINSVVFSEELNKYYLYFAIKEYFQYATPKQGATFGNMSKGEFENIKLICPDRQTLERFNDQVRFLFHKQLVNVKQVEALTTQRNTLLPLLMTGQIEV